MINITYRPDKYDITIKGHANYGESGTDIVCAASSMVFYNLCAVLSKCPEKWFAKKPEMGDGMADNSGNSYIRCTPASEYEQFVLFAFQYAVTGFEQLSSNYPDNVNLKITKH